MTPTVARRVRRVAAWLLILTAVAGPQGCGERRRLVEVFDNGPPGGPAGPSMGYRWVGANEWPTAGNHWKTVDINTLTPQQRARIHNDAPRALPSGQ